MEALWDLPCLTLLVQTIATTNRQEQFWKLKKLKNNKGIVILRPDKDNGLVIIKDNITYKIKMYALLNYERKFKQLSSDPTNLREGQLQRYLR